MFKRAFEGCEPRFAKPKQMTRGRGRLAYAPSRVKSDALQIAIETLVPVIFACRDGIFHPLHPAIDFVINAF